MKHPQFVYIACKQIYIDGDKDGYSYHMDSPEAAFTDIEKAYEYTRTAKPEYPCRCYEESCKEQNGYRVKELALT